MDETTMDAFASKMRDGELRAKRSLRVLQHQQRQIEFLTNELHGKSNLLERLQESHADLVEAHHYQTEVHELQKELIKLQEIQYLTEFVQQQPQAGSSSSPYKASSAGNTVLETATVTPSHSAIGQTSDGTKLNLPKLLSLKNASETSFPVVGFRASATDSMNNATVDENASDNAILLSLAAFMNDDDKEESKMNLGLNSTDSFKLLLQKQAGQQESASNKNNLRLTTATPSGGMRIVYKDYNKNSQTAAVPKSRPSECHPDVSSIEKDFAEPILNRDSALLQDDDDDNDKIFILRETLSSNRQSIEDLTAEVKNLRREKCELLSYVQSLLAEKFSSATNDASLDQSTRVNVSDKNKYSKQIKVILPVSVSQETYGSNNSNVDDGEVLPEKQVKVDTTDKKQDAVVATTVEEEGTESEQEEEESNNEETDGFENFCKVASGTNSLQQRARRLWDTACNFFTPKQAHFILTAPLPSDAEEDEEDSSLSSTETDK